MLARLVLTMLLKVFYFSVTLYIISHSQTVLGSTDTGFRHRNITGLYRCYGDYGCFYNDGRFQSLLRPYNPFPQSLDKIIVLFRLYTRFNPTKDQLLEVNAESIRSSNFRTGSPVKILIHAYLDNGLYPWIRRATKSFLQKDDVNVIVVDWRFASFGDYFHVAANARLVGAMIAKFIHIFEDSFSIPPSLVHLIGHSLGAHVAGYAGERINKVGRITGLDPAQPLFEGTHPVAHLDPTDAMFVDVIHADTEPLFTGWFGFGTGPPCGHIDFYPNGGETQPGCRRKTILETLEDEDFNLEQVPRKLAACDHDRVVDLFVESLDPPCPFTAIQCSSYLDYRKGRCFECGSDGEKCAPLGYHSEEWFHKVGFKMDLPVKMYLATGGRRPFCRYHHRVKVTISSKLNRNSAIGRFVIKFTGSNKTPWTMPLNNRQLTFHPGSSYIFAVASISPEPIHQVELNWIPRREPLLDRLLKRFFGSKDEVEVTDLTTEGLEIGYRCQFRVNERFTPRNRKKNLLSEKCENLAKENQKFIRWRLPESSNIFSISRR